MPMIINSPAPNFLCPIQIYFPAASPTSPTWRSNSYFTFNMSQRLIPALTPTPAPNPSSPQSVLFQYKTALFYQRVTFTVWKTFLITLFLLITHIYSTHQQIIPDISIITTSSAHIPTWVITISHLDYDKSLRLCLQFILNITRVILLKHKSITLLKTLHGFPFYSV